MNYNDPLMGHKVDFRMSNKMTNGHGSNLALMSNFQQAQTLQDNWNKQNKRKVARKQPSNGVVFKL